MKQMDQTVLEVVNHIIQQHPHLAPAIESIAGVAQGKGYGSETIAHEVAVVSKLLGKVPTLAIDIGGNIGDYSAQLRVDNEALEVHIFEPSLTNINKLTARFQGLDCVHVVPRGLSDTAGTATLFADVSGSGMGSLSKRSLDHLNIHFDVTEEIQTMVFEDYWVQVLQRRPIDIVKIDIEGHELAALRGFGAALQAVRVIQFEFGGTDIDTRTFFKDFWLLFVANQFDLYRITPFGELKISSYRESDECFSISNYVAVNRR